MSEILGGNNDGSSHEEPFDLDGFDNEWEKFNESLDVTTDEMAKALHLAEAYEAAHCEITERMLAMDIPRVIDEDEGVQTDLYHEFALAYFERKREERVLYDQDEDEFNRQITLQCVHDYYEERELEVMVFNTMLNMKVRINEDDSPEALQEIQILKKQMQAELLVLYKRGLDDGWQRLFNEVIPGESLDTTSQDDTIYIHLAQSVWYEFQYEQRFKKQLVAEAKAIMGVDDDGDMVEVAQATKDVLNMQAFAAEPVYSEAERANRNALLWDWVRKMPINSDIAQKLVEHFDSAYPITTVQDDYFEQ